MARPGDRRSPDSATAQMSTHTKRFVLHETAAHDIGKYSSAGTDRLRSRATHDVVGFSTFTGHYFLKQDKAVFLGALALRGGIINVRVTFHGYDAHFRGPIPGGTRVYQGIPGTVFGRQPSERGVVTLRYTL